MIQIYAPGNTNFDRNGDVALQPSLCDLDMTLNGEWELEIEAPADELGKFRAVTTGAVVAVPTPWSDKQLFRIYDHDTSDEGSVGLARPIFLDAENEVMILDKRPTNCIGQEALDAILSGTKYKGKSNITKTATAYYVRKNAIQAIASNEANSFINRWGGEIAYDNFTVTVNERMGRDRGLRVEFGRNIKSIHDHGNSEELATRIYPVAYNGRMISGDKQYVDSERIGDYPIVYSKILECQDIKLREDLIGEPSDGDIVCDTKAALDAALRQRCAEEYAAGADVLETAYDVDMDDLSTKEEYAEYKNLEKVELGDTVHCRHRRLKISADARTVRLVWNCILRKNKKLYIGDFKKDYFARLNDTAQRLQDLRDEMAESEGRVNQAVREASERLDKALKEAAGLYCTEKDDGKGGTIILLHDKKTLEESTNVIMLTADAIGFSTDGGNSYPYGFTIDGEFVARLLSAHGINADWIRAGILQSFPDEEGNIAFFLDLVKGILRMNATELTIGGKSVNEALSDAVTSVENQFYLSESPTGLSGGKWENKQPVWTPGKYIWSRQYVTYGNGENAYLPNEGGVCITGNTGAAGSNGTNGVGIESVVTEYILSPSDVSPEEDPSAHWGTTIHEPVDGMYIWTRQKITYTDGDVEYAGLYCMSKTMGDIAQKAVDKQTQEDIFNKLTNNGALQGLFMRDGMLYINAQYLRGDTIDLNVLKLAGTICGLMQGNGMTGSGKTTTGIVIYGNGLNNDGAAKPPYIIVTSDGIRLQLSDEGFGEYVYWSNGYMELMGESFTTHGNVNVASGSYGIAGHTAIEFDGYNLITFGAPFADGEYISRTLLRGLWVYINEDETGHDTYIRGENIYESQEPKRSSDARLKKNITPLSDACARMLDHLTPISYRYAREADDAPKHWGYTTQDVEEALRSVGLDRSDMAALGQYETETGEKYMALAYGELIAALHLKVKSLEARIAKLEEEK